MMNFKQTKTIDEILHILQRIICWSSFLFLWSCFVIHSTHLSLSFSFHLLLCYLYLQWKSERVQFFLICPQNLTKHRLTVIVHFLFILTDTYFTNKKVLCLSLVSHFLLVYYRNALVFFVCKRKKIMIKTTSWL
jgi:hypothetical protein